MAILISMPMFSVEPQISLDNIEKYIGENWKDVGSLEMEEPSDGTFGFHIGKAMVVVGLMRAPIPWTDLEGPCATSILWPKAKDELERQKYHLIVTVSSDELSLVDLSILLTQVTATILATTDEALGVFWNNSSMVIHRDIFIDFAIKVLPEGPPVHIWVDFRVGAGESNCSNCSTGFTSGLSALGFMEIEATNTPESVQNLRDRLTGLAEYIIFNNPTINDGDTVGGDQNEMIKVKHADSDFGHKGLVMQLNYSKAKLKKSSLKFW